MKNSQERARAYLATLPAAVSGAGGHSATFRAACLLVRFGLLDGDALALLREYNGRCLPPWTEKELAHKLQDARRVAGVSVRFSPQPAPAVRLVWKRTARKAAAPAAPKTAAPQTTTTPNCQPSTNAMLFEVRPVGDAPHLAGWTRNGSPIYQGTAHEWRAGLRAKLERRSQ